MSGNENLETPFGPIQERLTNLLYQAMSTGNFPRYDRVEELAQYLLEIFGTPSPDVSQTTQTSPGEGISDFSSLISQLGEVLEDLDILINTITRHRNNMQSSYNKFVAGLPGPSAPANLASAEEYCNHNFKILNYNHSLEHCSLCGKTRIRHEASN